MKKPRSYDSDDISVSFDLSRCIHAKECVNGLPRVFDPEARPWIDPRQGKAKKIAEVIRRCPTGALTYRPRDGSDAETPDADASAQVVPDGPVYLRGDFVIRLPGGSVTQAGRVALCRCGDSKNKPFCDNSHVEKGFRDEGALAGDPPAAKKTPPIVELSPLPDGPVVVKGTVTYRGAGGREQTGSGGALCRCGASSTKPFCDGSHVAAGFRAE